jgi:hypothetical protein
MRRSSALVGRDYARYRIFTRRLLEMPVQSYVYQELSPQKIKIDTLACRDILP